MISVMGLKLLVNDRLLDGGPSFTYQISEKINCTITVILSGKKTPRNDCEIKISKKKHEQAF